MRFATHVLAFIAGGLTFLVIAILDAVMPVRVRRKPEPDEPGGGFG